MTVISIDPGDSHVGYAEWEQKTLTRWCKITPPQAVIEIENRIGTGTLATLVIESYRLYPWLAQQQGYSELKTPQLIGVLKYLAWKAGANVIEQNATIKKRAFDKMTQDGYEMPKTNQHVRDAIAHGYWYLNR